MKKTILTTALLSVLLIGCKDSKTTDPAATTPEVIQEHDHNNEGVALNNAWTKDIELDNGKKWKANEETNIGVDKMMTLIDEADLKTVEDYHHLASKLNDEKNFVVRECTMKGPSHDNLHVFLHPLIDKIDALGKVSTKDQGSEITDSILKNLHAYSNYFE